MITRWFLPAVFLLAPLSAQWLKVPTPGVPRTANGKVDLSAPTPKTADGKTDFSGLWTPDTRLLQDIAADIKPAAVPFQPWAEKVFKDRANGNKGKDDPAAQCIPGMPKLNVLPYPYKIIQIPGEVVMLFEGFTTFRQIFTDGRDFPKELQPSWVGYSSAKWDGETLVVETRGINETTWLDNAGRPHSDAMRLIERFRRPDFGHFEITMTIDDPKAYTKPWTVVEKATYLADTELLEYVCTENNKDYEHLVGNK
jgi:hypothetical protein